MSPVPYILLAISLPLLLGGCGEKESPKRELEVRDELMYIKGSDALYTGEVSLFYKNGQKEQVTNYKNGKSDGFSISWHENGMEKVEGSFKGGKRLSLIHI